MKMELLVKAARFLRALFSNEKEMMRLAEQNADLRATVKAANAKLAELEGYIEKQQKILATMRELDHLVDDGKLREPDKYKRPS